MDYADIIARIAAAINDDEVAAITGPVGNGILNDMVAELGEGYQFAGILTPTSNPVRTDARLWALAMAPGKYYNLDGRVLADGQVAVFMWGGGWSSVVLSVTTAEAVRELLSQFMDAATADAEVDLKADELTPVVPPMVTGSARGILGRSAAARFLYRQTSSGSGAAWLRSIHGRTVSYNQLVQDRANFVTAGLTCSISGGKLTISGTASTTGVAEFRGIPTIAGHKYILQTDSNIYATGGINANTIHTASITGSHSIRMAVTQGQAYNMVCTLCFTDLTQAGLDTIITTAAEFEAWQMEQFGHKGYLDYTPGTLVSVNPTGVLTTGRNVWDEEWELGYYDRNTGVKVSSPSFIRSKNYISALPSTAYNIHNPGASLNGGRIIFMAGDKTIISSYLLNYVDEQVTTPSDTAYVVFYVSGNTYKHDICINISDPAFNGQYVPYNGHTLPLDFTEHFPAGLNGVNDVVDEVVSDENGKFKDGGKRFGKVDLGDLTWTYNASGFFLSTSLVGIIKPAPSTLIEANIICGHYHTTYWNNAIDKIIAANNSGWIRVADSSMGTDPAAFKTAMSGIPLIYELATPQHVTFTDPSDAVYPVTEGGTEQVLPVNGSEPTTIAPDFQMQAPLRRGYDTPTDATFDNFLEALGQHLGKTIAKEWDAETQTYQFDIL